MDKTALVPEGWGGFGGLVDVHIPFCQVVFWESSRIFLSVLAFIPRVHPTNWFWQGCSGGYCASMLVIGAL